MRKSECKEAQIAFVLRKAEDGATIGDTFTRHVPAIEARLGYRADDVIELLDWVGREHGFPQTPRVDQGSESASRALDPGV